MVYNVLGEEIFNFPWDRRSLAAMEVAAAEVQKAAAELSMWRGLTLEWMGSHKGRCLVVQPVTTLARSRASSFRPVVGGEVLTHLKKMGWITKYRFSH